MSKQYFSAFLFLSATQLQAATLSSIEFLDGQETDKYYSISITGSGFGEGPTVLMFDDFDNQTATDVELNKALIGQWTGGSSFPKRPKVVDYDDGKAISVSTPGTRQGNISQIEYVSPNPISNIFFSYSVVVPEGSFFAGATAEQTFPESSSWKFTWLLDGPNGSEGTTKYNVCIPSHVGRGNFMLVGNSIGYGYYNLAASWSWHTKNYMSFGVMPHETAPKEQNGHLIFQMTGKRGKALAINKTDTPIFVEKNPNTSFDRVQFPGWFGNGDFTNFQAYYDDIYIATGRNAFARVELSNGLNLQDSTINLTMPITSWSDTKIVFKLSKSAYRKADQFYLRIYDRTNKSSSYNFLCGKCPKPPKV